MFSLIHAVCRVFKHGLDPPISYSELDIYEHIYKILKEELEIDTLDIYSGMNFIFTDYNFDLFIIEVDYLITKHLSKFCVLGKKIIKPIVIFLDRYNHNSILNKRFKDCIISRFYFLVNFHNHFGITNIGVFLDVILFLLEKRAQCNNKLHLSINSSRLFLPRYVTLIAQSNEETVRRFLIILAGLKIYRVVQESINTDILNENLIYILLKKYNTNNTCDVEINRVKEEIRYKPYGIGEKIIGFNFHTKSKKENIHNNVNDMVDFFGTNDSNLLESRINEYINQ